MIVSNWKKILCFLLYILVLVLLLEFLFKVILLLKIVKVVLFVGDVCVKLIVWCVGYLFYFCCLKKIMIFWFCMFGVLGFFVEDIIIF